MRLFKFEINKLLIKQKALPIIIFFLLIKIMFLYLSPLKKDLMIERNKHNYIYYINILSGKLTEKKERYIKEEEKIIEDAKNSINILNSNLEKSKINEEQYIAKSKKYTKILDREKALKIILNELKYVENHKENRCFLYKTGWNELIAKENIDIIAIVLLLTIVVPFFANEYEKEMNLIIIPSKKGSREAVIIKIIVSILMVIAISSLFAFTEYTFYNVKYGLQGASYPLQSLEFFQNSTRDISILETFILINIIKTIGYILLVLISILLSIKVKNSLPAIFFSACTVCIPYFIFKTGELKYKLPGPLGEIIATGFFMGDIMSENKLIFKSLTLIQCMTIFGGVILLIIIIFVLILRAYSNFKVINKRHNRGASI